jgi:hypothetical protein
VAAVREERKDWLTALERLSEGVIRSWKTTGVYDKKRLVPEEYGHALATTAALRDLDRDSVKGLYIQSALWYAIYTWEGGQTIEALMGIRARCLREANRALNEDSQRPIRNWSEAPDSDDPDFATAPFDDEVGLSPSEEDARLEEAFSFASSVGSTHQKEILHYLRQNPGAKSGEIARALDSATGTIRVNWHRLLKRVRGQV